MQHLYGIDVSAALISNITNKIVPLLKEWQNRPLQDVYAVAFLDGIHSRSDLTARSSTKRPTW